MLGVMEVGGTLLGVGPGEERERGTLDFWLKNVSFSSELLI